MARQLNAGERGSNAERVAQHFLERHGLRLLDANWRSRRGEIDLVMKDPSGVIVFVEVRYRGTGAWADGATSVTATKQRRLIATAQAWLQRHGPDRPCRFDVVSVNGNGSPDWIVNAFGT
ncbi:MAG: YraN family protein [Aquisalimonadaceae bacterium]